MLKIRKEKKVSSNENIIYLDIIGLKKFYVFKHLFIPIPSKDSYCLHVKNGLVWNCVNTKTYRNADGEHREIIANYFWLEACDDLLDKLESEKKEGNVIQLKHYL